MSFSHAPVSLYNVVGMFNKFYKYLIRERDRSIVGEPYRHALDPVIEHSRTMEEIATDARLRSIANEVIQENRLQRSWEDYEDQYAHRAGARIRQRLNRVHPVV
jgi:hypothetical protein